MKLITKEIEAKLKKSPLYSTEKNPTPEVIVKFFTPDSNWTWYAVEGEKKEDGDWEFFGMVDGFDKELGYFTLEELKTVRGGLGLPVERDMYFDGKKLDKVNLEIL
jgi:hypothetical protein